MGPRNIAYQRPWRRLLCSAALAGTAALGIPATTSAASNNDAYEQVWDIEEYDHCVKFGYAPDVNCCIDSGGRWDGPNAGSGKCVAPDPPEDEDADKQTRPPKFRVPLVPPKSLIESDSDSDSDSKPGSDWPDGPIY